MTKRDEQVSLQIRKLQHPDEARVCAQFMANAEPWVTLRRTYDDSIQILEDPTSEIYMAIVDEKIVSFTILRLQGAFIGDIQTVGLMPEWRNRGAEGLHHLRTF